MEVMFVRFAGGKTKSIDLIGAVHLVQMLPKGAYLETIKCDMRPHLWPVTLQLESVGAKVRRVSDGAKENATRDNALADQNAAFKAMLVSTAP